MKKNSNLLKLLVVTIIVTILSFLGVNSYAEEGGIGFEIRPIKPNTQIDKSRGYYYIQTEPGKNQTFSLSILSTSDEEKEIEIRIENAVSSTQGTIAYSNDSERYHESLIHPITEIVQIKNQEIVLKPHEEVIVDFELTPPKEHYEGIKAGRMVVKEKTNKEDEGIKQEFEYGLGIMTSESGVAYNDGKTLNLDKVQANINLGAKAIEGYISNPEPKTIENLEVRSYVTKKGQSKKIKERNVDDFAFAPNSKVTYVIPWGLSDFESGEYTFHFDAKNQYETFNLKEDFTIRADDAKRLNKEVAFKISISYFIIGLIVILNIILFILFIIIIQRDRSWVNQLKNRKKKKNSGKKKSKKNK